MTVTKLIRPSIVLIILSLFVACGSSPDPAPAQTENPPASEAPAEEAPAEPASDPSASTGNATSSEPDRQTTARSMSETAPPVTVQAASGSFSPDQAEALTVFLTGAEELPIDRWEFAVVDADGSSMFRESGTGTPPEEISWSGRTTESDAADGTAVDGPYSPQLLLVFEDGSERMEAGRPFLVDTTAPQPRLEIGGVPFSPNGDRIRDELIVTIDADDASPIAEWLFEVRTADGTTLARFEDRSDVPRTARWNGRSGGSIAVESGEEYRVYGWVRDDAGNEADTTETFETGALTEDYRGRPRIILPRIQFPAESADPMAGTAAARRTYEQTLARTARILSGDEDLRILIEGHANATRFSGNDPDPVEQRNELLPLSLRRAEAVRRGLIDRGIDPGRLEVGGVGAADPLVPFDGTDLLRNRRIELYLID